MAEYWKSQPKKFCDFCKCWIAENKASIDFHENGKKHQENVKLRINEVKKKGTERRQQQEQLNDDLAAIEAAALEAYKKDLGLSKASNIKVQKQENELESKSRLSEHRSDVSSDVSTWGAYQTLEGYWYYYNSETGESRWDPPQGCQPQHIRTISQEEQKVTENLGTETVKNVTKDENPPKENTNSPYGHWETVAVYERNDNPNTKSEETSKANDTNDELLVAKFREKQLPTAQGINVSENVAFKKRKSSQEKKRSIRQRTNDS